MGSSYEDRFLPAGMRPAGMGPPAGYRQDSLEESDMPGSFPSTSTDDDELHLPTNGHSYAPPPSQKRKNSRPTDLASGSPMDLDIPSESDIRKARSGSDHSPRSPAGRERSRTHGGRRGSSNTRTCGKCGGHLNGQFVRALENTYHLECFTCHVGFRNSPQIAYQLY